MAELLAIVDTWLISVGIAIPVFAAIEAWLPRARTKPRWKAIALAAGLFAINRLVAKLTNHSPESTDAIRICAAWLLAELIGYGLHVAMHRVPLLWRFHKLHHDPAPLSFERTWWVHPVDIAMFGGATTLACAIAGAPLAAAPLVLVIKRGWGVLSHANIAWPATPLDHVLVTPRIHDRHHREDLPPANFAANLAIVDRLFGTWRR